MNTFTSFVMFGSLALSDFLFVRILWLGIRAEGSRSRTAAWLFFTGLGVAGMIADDTMHGHHPLAAVAVGLACGLALCSLARFMPERPGVHGPRTDVNAGAR